MPLVRPGRGFHRGRMPRQEAASRHHQILTAVLRSGGLSVRELSEALGLSYMGAKRHCGELARRGLMKTWRRPSRMGRPELAWQLTERGLARACPPAPGLAAELLAAATAAFGRDAGERLLFALYRERTGRAEAAMKGATRLARLRALAAWRNLNGYVSDAVDESLVDYHQPFAPVEGEMPILQRLEETLAVRALGFPVRRTETRAGAARQVRYTPAA